MTFFALFHWPRPPSIAQAEAPPCEAGVGRTSKTRLSRGRRGSITETVAVWRGAPFLRPPRRRAGARARHAALPCASRTSTAGFRTTDGVPDNAFVRISDNPDTRGHAQDNTGQRRSRNCPRPDNRTSLLGDVRLSGSSAGTVMLAIPNRPKSRSAPSQEVWSASAERFGAGSRHRLTR